MTTFNLYKGVPWGIGTPHVKYCETDADKMSFLSTYLFRSIANFNIVTPREAIVEGTTNDLFTCGYCAFTIKGEKFYCFVTYVENINEDCCRLQLKPDYLFMYINQISWKRSFVNRIHIGNDNYNVRTSEGLNPSLHTYYRKNVFDTTGEGDTENKIVVFTNLDSDCSIGTISSSYVLSLNETSLNGYLPYMVNDLKEFSQWLQNVNSAGLSENIMGIFVVPRKVIQVSDNPNGYITTSPPNGTRALSITSSGLIEIPKTTIENALSNITNYNNNKMLYSPEFNQIVLCDGINEQKFDYYKWSGNYISFNWRLEFNTDLSLAIAPANYNGQSLSLEETFQVTNFPSIAYNCDTSKIWYANNKASLRATERANLLNEAKGTMNLGIDAGSTALSMTGSLLNGNVGGAVKDFSNVGDSAKSYISTEVEFQIATEALEAKISDHSIPVNKTITPASSLSCYSLARSDSKTPLLNLYCRAPNLNDFIACDDFMSAYGYTYNDLRVPSFRSSYTYVKLEQPNFTCSCNNEARAEINNAFIKGLTVWKQNTMYAY